MILAGVQFLLVSHFSCALLCNFFKEEFRISQVIFKDTISVSHSKS